MKKLYLDSPQKYPLPTVVPVVLVWTFMLLVPVMFFRPMELVDHFPLEDLARYYVPLILAGTIFTVNQYFLVPRYFSTKKHGRFIFFNLMLFLLLLVVREVTFYFVEGEYVHGIDYFVNNYSFSGARGKMDRGIVGTIIFIVSAYIISAICALFSSSVDRTMKAFVSRDQEQARLQYELSFLKNQLSPHFLFNTLNNISALMTFDPKRAEASMNKLSQLLRVMLYQSSNEMIEVGEDIGVLEKYADLERLRLDSSVDFKFEVDIDDPHAMIAPLVAMPLMENIMKHCLNPDGPSFAHVKITLKEGILLFHGENSDFPRKSKPNSSGLGLSTFTKRLELIYPKAHRYWVKRENGVYVSNLEIKLE